MKELTDTATAIAQRCGIRLPPNRVMEAVEVLSREGPEPEDSGSSGEALVGRLIDALTVKESYFLRQPEQLRALDWTELLAHAIADGRDRIRVWSAACAHGEEPYTLALLAAESFGEQSPPVDILGTDIAAGALEQAAAGVYGARAVRQLSADTKKRFFETRGCGWAVSTRLRDVVRFKQHNLARDPMPPAGEQPFDLIVCRNVLIYFEPFALGHFTGELPRAIGSAGQVVLGAADRLCLTQTSLRDMAAFRGSAAARARPFSHGPRPARPGDGAAPGRAAPGGDGPTARQSRPRRDEERPPRDISDPALAGALRLADAGDIEDASKVTVSIVEADPLNAPAQFVLGTLQLARGDPATAVRALRAALYADPSFAAAAFQLGRAHDMLGQDPPARRAYRRALEGLEAEPSRYPWLLEDVDTADLAVACAARLARR